MVVEKATIKGTELLNKKLASMQRAGKNLRPYWNIAKSIMWKSVAKRFQQGGGSAGKWAPLSDATVILRPHGGNRPMMDTGDLMRSVTTEPSVVRQTSHELIIGTNKRQAKLLSDGFSFTVTPKMKGYFAAHGLVEAGLGSTINVPGRKFLYIDAKDKVALNKGLKFYFSDAARRGG